eukprot:UN14159
MFNIFWIIRGSFKVYGKNFFSKSEKSYISLSND